jgi:hypothetical protein
MVLKIKPLLAVVGLGVCMCVSVIITLGNQTPALVLESADSEHAIENSFFDSLAAKDLAKDRRSRKSKDLNSKQTALSDKQERQVENNYFKGVGKDKGKTQSKLGVFQLPSPDTVAHEDLDSLKWLTGGYSTDSE